MKKSILNSLLLMAAVSGGLAGAVYAEGANEMQRLSGLKQIKQQGLEARLNVLQQERACVMAAVTMEALNACDQMSRQMMEKMQEQQKASWENFKAASQRDTENSKQ
jgi:hypothetical protein